MDIVTTGVGVAIVLYGAYSIYLRFSVPEKLGKLEAMKNRFGGVAGGLLHVTAYTLMPIIVGIVVILAGLGGMSLTEFLLAQ